jgi:hypothetical protein
MKRESGLPERPNILVVYYWTRYPLQPALADHLWCFKRYSRARCFYVNLAFRTIPRYLRHLSFDLVIFHKLFLDQRWSQTRFNKLLARIRMLAELPGPKAILPQDEYIEPRRLADFVSAFGVTHVFSVSPPSEWPKLYPGIDRTKVRFEQVLTGYIDDHTRDHVETLCRKRTTRGIDIGYRAYSRPWLGRIGQLKHKLGAAFQNSEQTEGLILDVSNKYGDTFLGDEWYLFLLRCKYTLGVEGGSSLLDVDGTAIRKTEDYLTSHPAAPFAEVEANCFPGQDGTLSVSVLSPRHLEACITRTCQILVSGEYNGVLEPGRHYIELLSDFSNLDEVVVAVKDDSARRHITETAYHDVVASGRYSYRAFVQWLLSVTLPAERQSGESGFTADLAHIRCEAADRVSWLGVMALGRLKFGVQRILFRFFSEDAVLGVWKRLLTGRSTRRAD